MNTSYPKHDKEFQDHKIEKVGLHDGSYTITCDGWSLWCGESCPLVPKVGQTARQYGSRGQVRGLFIGGVKIWYRSDAAQKEYIGIQQYGADAADWLARWDAGKSVWSIEMGGLGPGYEQCIHITCAEILRWFLKHKPDADKWKDTEVWKADRKRMEDWLHTVPVVKSLGLSGAQFGAALSLAAQLYKHGPRKIMADEQVKDRHIQVSRSFPGMAA
jgi:hypothetical protein